MFRLRTKCVSERQFPRNNGREMFRWGTTACGDAGEGKMTARTAVVVMAGAVALHLHAEYVS